jgi:two-component system NtrC family sensor kinase
LEEKAFELQRTVVESHAQAIESYLDERLKLLELLAESRTQAEMANPVNLRKLFDGLNQVSDGGFIDLGVIGPDGSHLAYLGPYDLQGRNYKDADWFREVRARGVYISDVFLGYRQVPHCIVAIEVGGGDEGGSWVLRATIDSEQFSHLVRSGVLGETGETYIVNRDGLYQTKPLVGAVMDRSPLPPVPDHRGVRDLRLQVDGDTKFMATIWLNGGRWILVAQQDAAEIRAPVTRAVGQGMTLVLVSVILVGGTTSLATRHLTRQIDSANQQLEEMLGAFLRSAKLASVGELATGLAHEINNPLAILSAQQTNIADLIQDMDPATPTRDELLAAVQRCKRQIVRCGGITQKMLLFGRKQESLLQPTDIAPRLQEIVTLMERQAADANIELELKIAEGLPEALLDPVELEQLLVNLIKNALDALPQGGRIDVVAYHQKDAVCLEVRDDGPGIPSGQIQRIFEPFFTTKPVGKGTGLGLSVCYGIVQSWGGRIEAESEPGRGTVMRITLPLPTGKGMPVRA